MEISGKVFVAKGDFFGWKEVPFGMPEGEMVLVRVKAAGVNRADILQLAGKYKIPAGESNVPGLEFSGEVIEVGDQVTSVQIGDRVCGLCGSGAYAELINIHQDLLMRLPEEISFEEGAAITESWCTALYNLHFKAGLKKDESVLIHSAGGGVGMAGIQYARSIGAKVIASSGDSEKLSIASDLGAEGIFNYKDHTYAELVNLYRDSIDVILDTVGASALKEHQEVLKRDGRILLIGLLGGSSSQIDLGLLLRKNASILSSTLRSRPLVEKAKLCRFLDESVIPKIKLGEYKPMVAKVFHYTEVEKSHQYIKNNENIGNVVFSF